MARLCRTLLFVPGHKSEWIESALASGTDGVLLDLEDSVSLDRKAASRRVVRESLQRLAESPRAVDRFVRVNPWRTGKLLDDVLETAGPHVTGYCVPKVDGPEDIMALDMVLTELEASRGLPAGSIEIFPLPETARGIRQSYEVCSASPRVTRMAGFVNASPSSDVSRALGVDRDADRVGVLYAGGKANLDARAAGVRQLVAAPPLTIGDLDAVRAGSLTAKRFGCTGSMLIHPSHVGTVNEVFSPSDQDIDAAVRVLRELARVVAEGDAASTMDGHMVDYAHAKSALDLIDVCRSFGIEVPPYPELDLDTYDPG
jgi:citrate lyase subunit beta/citryl-CoA lyase